MSLLNRAVSMGAIGTLVIGGVILGASAANAAGPDRVAGSSTSRGQAAANPSASPVGGRLGTDSLAAGFALEAESIPLTATVQSVDHAARSAVLSGTAEPGAFVLVQAPTGIQHTSVDSSGTWSLTVTGLADGTNDLLVGMQVVGVVISVTTVTVIVDELHPPVAHPAIAGGALALALGGLLHRRKTALSEEGFH